MRIEALVAIVVDGTVMNRETYKRHLIHEELLLNMHKMRASGWVCMLRNTGIAVVWREGFRPIDARHNETTMAL